MTSAKPGRFRRPGASTICSLIVFAAFVSLPSVARAGHYDYADTQPTYTGGHVSFNGNTYDYNLGGDGWYGGYGQSSGLGASATCGDQITANFKWYPDGEGDTHPDQVIVMETCRAQWGGGGYYFNPPPVGACNNSLGFPEANQISIGTRWKIMSGADMVTFNTSPSANSVCQFGSAFASVRYRAWVYPLSITLTGGIRPTYKKRYLVGQSAGASLDGCGLTPDDNTWLWSVSGGGPFLSYAPTSASASYVGWQAEQIPSISFYFARPEGQASVMCQVHVDVPAGDIPAAGFDVSVQRRCAVDAPTFDAAPIGEFGKMRLNGNGMKLLAPPDYINGTYWGKVVDTTGLAVEYGTGTWMYAQLWAPSHDYTDANQVVHTWSNNSVNGQMGLDNQFPYLGLSHATDGSAWTTADGPGQGFADGSIRNHMADSFNTYVMFLPPGSGTYVPLRTWTWKAVGVATLANNAWVVADFSSAPSGLSDYPAFPEWSFAILNNSGGWIPPP